MRFSKRFFDTDLCKCEKNKLNPFVPITAILNIQFWNICYKISNQFFFLTFPVKAFSRSNLQYVKYGKILVASSKIRTINN
jgi:hypothetical protein